MTILVTGATGNVGRRVIDQLLDASAKVRAVSRDPATATLPAGVQTIRGDLNDPATLTEALHGIKRIFLFPVPETAQRVASLAREAGVDHVVVLSSAAVTAGYDTSFHLPVERAVERAGLTWTHVRPGEFALNKLYLWGPGIRADRTVRDPFPNAVEIPTHEADIADVTATALLGDGHAGKAYTFAGPGPVTHREQVAAIAAAIGDDISFDQVSPEEAREYYRKQGGWAAANADYLLGFEDYEGDQTSEPEAGHEWDAAAVPALETAEQVTGKPGRTFAEWALDHADDFR